MKNIFGNTGKTVQMLGLVAAMGALPLMIGLTGCESDGRYYHHHSGEYVYDHDLSAEVRGTLHHDREFKFSDVQVTTYQGVVQLSGFVVSQGQKSRAGDLAKSVPGVKEVENNITVKE